MKMEMEMMERNEETPPVAAGASGDDRPSGSVPAAVTPLERIVFRPAETPSGPAAAAGTRAALAGLFSPSFESPDAPASPAGDPPEGAALLLLPLSAEIDPALEAALEAVLPEPSRVRLSRFARPLRRRQSLFGRLLAQRLANIASETADAAFFLRERPPEGPLLADLDGRPVGRFAIAHTDTGVAVALSCRPMGVDLEARRMHPRLERLSGFALGEAFERRIRDLLAVDPARALDVFFGAWGAIECEQKMNGEDRKSAAPELDDMLRKYARPQSVEVSWDDAVPGLRTASPEGGPVRLELLETGIGLLTVLGAPRTRSIELLDPAPEKLLEEFDAHVRSFL